MNNDLDRAIFEYRERGGKMYIPDVNRPPEFPGEGLYTTNYYKLAFEHVANIYPYVIYAKPILMDLPPGAVIGNYQYSLPGKVRFIFNRKKEIVPGVLPADVARAWVRDQFLLPIPRRKTQLAHGFSVPLHARRGFWGECHYVDISKAYVSFLRFGYDVEYKLGEYIGALPRPVPHEIKSNKGVYSTAVTMSGNALANLEVMGKQGVYDRHPMNIFSNPCLFALAHDTLSGIASEMLAVMGDKCVYINTDGYIIRNGYERYALDIVQSWGLSAKIKYSGEAEVRGVGSYKVGEYKTRRFDESGGDHTNEMLDRDQRHWLKYEITRWFARLGD